MRAEFQLKGEAIARSSFTDLLYLDSDNVPLRDPTYLFSSPAFREHGYVLWPDFSKDSADNPIWRLTDTPCNPDQWQAESGQVLVSKTANGGMALAALLVADEMNRDIAFWYKLSGGDKDTFRYATFFLGVGYTAVEAYPASVGSVVPAHEGHTFCGIAMLQHGLAADEWQLPDVQDKLRPGFSPPKQAPPLFMHANLLKHSSGESFIRLLTQTRGLPDHAHVPPSAGNRPGSSFQLVKYPDPSSAFLRTDLRFKVSMYRGMCTDVWDGSQSLEGGAGNHGEDAEQGSFELGRVQIEDAKEAYGGLLATFEDVSGGPPRAPSPCDAVLTALVNSALVHRCTLRKVVKPVVTETEKCTDPSVTQACPSLRARRASQLKPTHTTPTSEAPV